MPRLIFILFFIINTYSQKDYSVTLVLDSSKGEMEVNENDKYLNFIIKFKAHKSITDYHLNVNVDGILEKNKIVNSPEDCCAFLLSKRKIPGKGNYIKLSEVVNPITHDDIFDVTFKNLNDILKNAKTIYLIDLSETPQNGKRKVYAVSFDL